MYRWIPSLLIILIAVCSPVPEPESYPPVTLQGTEVRTLTSQAVEGMEYKIWVAVPGNYSESSDTYPVVYLLDAKDCFGLNFNTYHIFRYFNDIPPLILVGITYEGDIHDLLFNRSRDFTPTALSRDQLAEKYGQQIANLTPTSGGAQDFLRFFEKELMPFIESEYRADPNSRGIFGYSYGGLFCTYALFNRPELFDRYFIGSPGIYWDDFVVLEQEEVYAASHDSLPVKLYVTVGSEEDEAEIDSWEQLCDRLTSREYKGLELSSEILEGETHMSGVGIGYSRAYRRLYGR